MSRTYARVMWGILLIGGGLLLLLQNLNLISSVHGWAWGVLFAIVGLLFIAVRLRDPSQIFAVIPGVILLALATMIIVDDLANWLSGAWEGGFFLGSIGLSFLLVYLQRRQMWWAIIPAGTMFTLAIVAATAEALGGMSSGVILFFGLTITFALVYFLPGAEGKTRWAVYPAVVLAVLGFLIGIGQGGLINYFEAVVLIVLGAFLIFRAFRGRTNAV